MRFVVELCLIFSAAAAVWPAHYTAIAHAEEPGLAEMSRDVILSVWEKVTQLLLQAGKESEDTTMIANENLMADFETLASDGCITKFKLQAKTGSLQYAGYSSSYWNGKTHHIQLTLKSGEKLQGDLLNTAYKNWPYNFERYFSSLFGTHSGKCVRKNDIVAVNLVAGGRDSWYATYIKTYVKLGSGPYKELTNDNPFNKWLDSDDHDIYGYDASTQTLTLISPPATENCITKFKMEAWTGNSSYSGYSYTNMNGTTHHIELTLKNYEVLQGDLLKNASEDNPYNLEKDFSSLFGTHSGKCVHKNDIVQVSLVAGGRDSWYATYIKTYVKVGSGLYINLTNDDPFNKWLDSDEPDQDPVRVGDDQRLDLYPYDATKQILSLTSQDNPTCGYGTPSCECREDANICVFNLEIDELMTFTSYRKFRVGANEGLFVRGTQGVVYYINKTTGEEGPLKVYMDQGRTCAVKPTKEECSDPQYVDGKTYRMAIGVNGQIPGPTLIVHDGQIVVIHVHNNMSSEGISIHWHGMHQIGTPWMDGVGQVTQCQIGPSSSFTYMYTASPSGTFWYHSHSGAQRTDGFFGALIVKEREKRLQDIKDELEMSFKDLPAEHSISLLDWQHESSLPTFSQLNAGLGFFLKEEFGEALPFDAERYDSTRSIERAEVGPVPYFSGLINGKGRHNDVPYSKTRLSVFTVEEGENYRFRLIGAQGLYAYKFSIDGHKLTVVNTDGYWIEKVEDVDFIIIHTGERYDFILEANQPFQDYWIRAETLEINQDGDRPPYKSLGHVAEAILQYKKKEENATEINSTQYEEIKRKSPPLSCKPGNGKGCKAVNCPFEKFQEKYYTKCINVHELRLLENTTDHELPSPYPSNDCTDEEKCLHFINFNFEGDSETSSVNGRNFILPPVPPQTQNSDYQDQANQCDLTTDCNPTTLGCMCTHLVSIPHKKTVQFVLSAMGAYDNAHPIHLHGHTFHVVHIGYPEYDDSTGFIKQNSKGESIHNPDIYCEDSTCSQNNCNSRRCTRPRWRNNRPPQLSIDSQTIRKDTVMVPAGGYVVINFISDNPGHWFLHCHIEVHQLEGMAMIVNEAFDEQKKLQVPPSMNKCGDFALTVGQYMRLTAHSFTAAGQESNSTNVH